MQTKPTIKEIAKIAKVSIGTVDRVLHNRGDVSPSTRKNIQRIMKELDYVPNTYARSLALNKILKIAVLLPEHKKGEYWTYPLNGAKKAKKDFLSLGIEIIIYTYDQNEITSFERACQQIFKEECNAVLLSQVLQKETSFFLTECTQRKLPFVLIGSNTKDTGALTNIGQNSYYGGRLAGELIRYGHSHRAVYLILNIIQSKNPNMNVDERITGFKAYFDDRMEDNKIELFCIAQEEVGLIHKIKRKLDSFTKLDGIFVPNSKSYILAEALSYRKDFRIIGYDLLDTNKELLENGVVDFLINQRPYEQTYQGIEFLYRHLILGEIPPPLISHPLDIVSKEKLMYY